MTKFFNYSILICSILIAFFSIKHVYMQEKIDSFCDKMRERRMPKEECYFVVDYIQKNTNILIRAEFNDVIIKKQDLKAHPSLFLPYMAAELEYKRLER